MSSCGVESRSMPTYHDTNAAVGRQIMDEAGMEEGSR
jgi:hypothetical protein